MRSAARLALAVAVAAAASRAEAFPAFARKYGMSCSACHVAWPIFNQVGQNFRDNGYQFGLGKDDPITLSQAYVPISLRTTPAYQYTRTTNQATNDNTAVTTVTPVANSPKASRSCRWEKELVGPLIGVAYITLAGCGSRGAPSISR